MKSQSNTEEHRWYRTSEISPWTEEQLEDYFSSHGLKTELLAAPLS